MSASSSTISMSCAMGDRTQLRRRLGRLGADQGADIAGEYQPHARSTALAIFQHQLSLMIFHDLFDDGEAQACALSPRGHIRLGQPLAAALRQALAVILDDEHDFAVFLPRRHPNLTRRVLTALDASRLD